MEPIDEAFVPNLGTQMSAIACLCNRIVTAVRKPYDLSVSEFHALLTIKTRHPSCVSSLTEWMEMDKTRMSKVLRSLEDRGYIERSTDQEDHRIDHIHLTEAGTQLAHALLFRLDEAGKALVTGVSEQERSAFAHFLELSGNVRNTNTLFSTHH
jgi:DNA-binding MarR family transcriptional regulator